MAEIGISRFTAAASSVIAEVESGSVFIVTRRGHPAAVLMPIEDAEDIVLGDADEYVRMRRSARSAFMKGNSVSLDDLQ